MCLYISCSLHKNRVIYLNKYREKYKHEYKLYEIK